MILLDDELPGPLSIGQVSALKVTCQQENPLVRDCWTGLFFEPCCSVILVKLFKFTLCSVKKNSLIIGKITFLVMFPRNKK